MSLADDILAAAAVPTFLHVGGQSGTMKGPVADDLVVTGVLTRPTGTSEDGETGERAEETWLWTVAASDVSSPDAYDELTTGGDAWSLIQPPEKGPGAAITYRIMKVARSEWAITGQRGLR